MYQTCNFCCTGSTVRDRLQAIADAIPVHRYVASDIAAEAACCCSCQPSCCQSACCCQNSCGCQNSCSCQSSCGCQNSCGCQDTCCCGDGPIRYYGAAAQDVAAGSPLSFSQYVPGGDGTAGTTVYLPGGRYRMAYSANASAVSGAAATLGLAPVINGVAYPRGGSFASVPAGSSASLSSTFVVTLPNAVNTLGFYNPGTEATRYQLFNAVVEKIL